MEDDGHLVAVPEPVLADENPYSTSSCTTLEGEVLSEYARMARNLEKLTALTNRLQAGQPEVLQQLAPLERKMGLVLTLFKASVWAAYVSAEAKEEQEELDNLHRQQGQ